MTPELGNIHHATRSYERWLRTSMAVSAVESELTAKHEQMKADPFLFFRGTYYRWAQLWPVVCKEVTRAPQVLAVGDLHVGSFGTWRDGEGRLCWGVDDFDDAYPLPYTNDLVRLAASVKMLIDSGEIGVKFRAACDVILEGYVHTLKEGGRPIVLAENETDLEQLGFQSLKPAPDFWRKLQRHPPVRTGQLPREAGAAIHATLPDSCPQPKWCGGGPAWEAWDNRGLSPLQTGGAAALPGKPKRICRPRACGSRGAPHAGLATTNN